MARASKVEVISSRVVRGLLKLLPMDVRVCILMFAAQRRIKQVSKRAVRARSPNV
jgi:hypothetical protein